MSKGQCQSTALKFRPNPSELALEAAEDLFSNEGPSNSPAGYVFSVSLLSSPAQAPRAPRVLRLHTRTVCGLCEAGECTELSQCLDLLTHLSTWLSRCIIDSLSIRCWVRDKEIEPSQPCLLRPSLWSGGAFMTAAYGFDRTQL